MIRTAKLASVTYADAAPHTVYTCPAGTVVIVKTIHASNRGGTAQLLLVSLQRPGGGTDAFVSLLEQTVNSNATVTVSTWAVMTENDLIQVYANTNRGDFWISGTVLTSI